MVHDELAPGVSYEFGVRGRLHFAPTATPTPEQPTQF